MEAIKMQIWKKNKNKFVFGESISQTVTYAKQQLILGLLLNHLYMMKNERI